MQPSAKIGSVAQISFVLLILYCMGCRRSPTSKVANIELTKDMGTVVDAGSGVSVSHVFHVRNPTKNSNWHLTRVTKSCVCDGNVPAVVDIPAGGVSSVPISGRMNSDDAVVIRRLQATYDTDNGKELNATIPNQLQLILVARVVPRLAVILDSQSTIVESEAGQPVHFLSGCLIYQTLPSEVREDVRITSEDLILKSMAVTEQLEKGLFERRLVFRAEVPLKTIEQATHRHSADIHVHLDGQRIHKRLHFVSSSGVICEPSAVFLRGSNENRLLGSVTLRSQQEFSIRAITPSTSRFQILGDASHRAKTHTLDFTLEMSETDSSLEKHELVITLDQVGNPKTRLPVFVFRTTD